MAQGEGKIVADGNIKTSFLNQADVRAKGDVSVTTSILHSRVESYGSIICNQWKGNVCGGSISAVKGIDVNEIGNQMNTPTNVYIGVSQSVIEQEKTSRRQKNEANDQLQKLGKLLRRLVDKEKEGPLTSQEKSTKERIRKSFTEVYEALNEAGSTLEELEEAVSSNENAKVIIRKHVFPMTDFHFGKYRRRVAKGYQGVVFFLENSEIKFESL